MSAKEPKRVYHRLEILATDRSTEIWLGDNQGFFVQKETGRLVTSLLPGEYVVEFGLGTTTYPIKLDGNCKVTQQELEMGPSCPRPIPNLSSEDD